MCPSCNVALLSIIMNVAQKGVELRNPCKIPCNGSMGADIPKAPKGPPKAW